MVPIQIWRYEPPKRRLRIKSKVRFVIFLVVLILILLAILIPRESAGNISYRQYRVEYGDTYWDIARQLQKAGYKTKEDIREIVHELIRESGIPAHKLREGDVILVPVVDSIN